MAANRRRIDTAPYRRKRESTSLSSIRGICVLTVLTLSVAIVSCSYPGNGASAIHQDGVELASEAPLSNLTLLSDGKTIYAAHSPSEVVDVFRGGQGVFGIAVGPVQEELVGEIHRLFPDRTIGAGHEVAASTAASH